MFDKGSALQKGVQFLLLLLTTALLIHPVTNAQEKNPIKVEVNKTTVNTGEIFTYSITIEGGFVSPEVTLPKFEDFEIVSQSQTQNYSFLKNRKQISMKLLYGLFAPKPGVFTIDGPIIKDRGKKIKAKAVTIEVKGEPLYKKRRVPPSLERGLDI